MSYSNHRTPNTKRRSSKELERKDRLLSCKGRAFSLTANFSKATTESKFKKNLPVWDSQPRENLGKYRLSGLTKTSCIYYQCTVSKGNVKDMLEGEGYYTK